MPDIRETWLTPNRHTRLILDIEAPVSIRPPWSVRRKGRQVSTTRTAAAATDGVAIQPGDGWTLRPTRDDYSRVTDANWGGGFRGVEVNKGLGWDEVATFRSPTDLTGIGTAGTVVSPSSYAFYKQVPAGTTWSSTLAADVTARAQPTQETADIPMDRVISSITSYASNAAFAVLFRLPPGFNQIDTLFTFYFGGAAETFPTGTHGGEFAVTVRGSGKAILFEWSGSAWVKRLEWPAFPAGLTGNMATVSLRVFPYGNDTIALSGGSMDGQGTFSGPVYGQFLAGAAQARGRYSTFYRNNPAVSGYTTSKSMTGAGITRLDVRRDLRTYVQLVHLKFPTTGTLVDLPFWCPFPLPADSPLVVTRRAFLPTGTTLSVALYDADTDAALTPIGSTLWNWTFQSNAGQQAYYAKWTLTADDSTFQTPVLYAYQVDTPAETTNLVPVSITGGALRRVSVTGPDLDPSQETASCTVSDPRNELSILRVRGRIPGRLVILNDAGVVTTILEEGEVNLATATKMGRPGFVYPSPLWHDYECSLVGQWAKLAEHINMSLVSFVEDPFHRVDDQGKILPWRVTDIILHLLSLVGYAAEQLDIPDIPIHLFPTGQNEEDYVLQPTVSIAEFVNTLAEKYLAMTLIWDANAGLTGIWRLLPQNISGQPILARFLGTAPFPGQLAHHPNSYPAGTTWIEAGSYREEARAPEGNFVLVVGSAFEGPSQVASSMYNATSFNFLGPTANPLHPDYLGRFVPIVHVDPTLATLNAVAFVCRRIYNFACHGFRWFKWRSPLLLIDDVGDPLRRNRRMLRLQDAVLVQGQLCIMRSCSASFDHDGCQMMDCEAVSITGVA